MAYSPFSLRLDEIEALRAVRDGRGILEVERDVRTYVMGWAPAKTEMSVWIGVGASEEEACADLEEKLEALAAYEDLADEIGIIPPRYRDLVEDVHAVARERCVDQNLIDDIALVREWERHSAMSAASWLVPDEDDIERFVDRLAPASGCLAGT